MKVQYAFLKQTLNNFIVYNGLSKKRNEMKNKIFEVVKNHTENEETAIQLTNELCVLLGVSDTLACECPPSEADFTFDGLPCDWCTNCGRKKQIITANARVNRRFNAV